MTSDETKRVLVVASDPQTRQWLSRWFQENGFDPVEVQSVESVPAQLTAGTVLVISDIDSLDSDISRLIQFVRSVSSDLPVISVAGTASLETAVRSLQNGGTDFLMKPVNATEMSVRVDRALKDRELRDELATHRSSNPQSQLVGGLANAKTEVKTLQKIEREAIIEALDGFGGARGKTAKALGISVRTLQRKIKEYGYTNGGDKQKPAFSAANQSDPLNN